MVWRFSWCTLVALFVLLFVAAEGLRGQTTQIEPHKVQNATGRGISRFNARTIEQTTEESTSVSSRSRLDRERNFQFRKTSNVKPIEETPTEANTLRSKPRLLRTTERSSTSKHAKIETTNIEAGNNPRGRSMGRPSADAAKAEPTISRRSDRQYSSSDDDSKRVRGNQNETAKDRHSSRRTITRSGTEKLDSTGPSVFTGAPDRLSFRTGRKIQTSFTSRELKKQVPPSKRFENPTGEAVESTTAARKRDEARNGLGNRKLERNKARSNRSRANIKEIDNSLNRKGQDLLSESESVRVDIPFTTTTLPSLTTLSSSSESPERSRQTSRGSNRRSDAKETSKLNTKDTPIKNRGRGSDSESTSSNLRRRGSSKFSDPSTTETTDQAVTPKSRNANVRDRSRSESRSRSRTAQDSGNAFSGQESRRRPSDRNSTDRRSRVLDTKPKLSEQDTRRSRGRSRVDPTTTSLPAVITTISTPDVTASETVTISTTEADVMITTINSNPTTTSTTTIRPSTIASTSTESSTRGRGRGRGNSHGRTPPKEDFFNHGLGFRGRKVSPEGSPSSNESRRSSTQRNETQNRGNPGWTLRRRPGHSSKSESTPQAYTPSKEQTNEIIPQNEQITSTEVITKIETSTSTLRRGSKKLKSSEESTIAIDASTKAPRRGNKTFDKNGSPKTAAENAESDNYPPEFKARLSQLKNNNSKVPQPKPTTRAAPEAKKSSAVLFAERSRMKLELARRLVKPELNVEENALEPSTISSLAKSKSSEIPVDESAKVVKITNQESSLRGESKKGVERGEEVTTRLSGGKKGRIISERMVTSISVEEGKHIDIEETTKPYEPSTSAVPTLSTEAVSETTDRARFSVSNSGEKYEETSMAPLSRGSRYLERLSSTTPKPKKSYSQARANKHYSGERREKTTSEENSTKKTKPSKTTFRPRYSKRIKQKSLEDQNEIEYQATTTQRSPSVTSRYMRKKVEFKTVEEKLKLTSAETSEKQTKRREFRPRTATYRRHSEVPTTLTEATTKAGVTGVAITPRSPRYHATLKSSTTPQSTYQEPQVNLQVSNETAAQSEAITDSSNGDSGNSNIFSPTRSSLFLNGNNTLLEQIRSTVAPLLSSLGNKSPIFAGAYSNVNNANSAPRITPSGSPPRFSARYKGAELFVRKPSPYQAGVPSVTSSSTTPVTLLENSGAVPPIDVSSPGEPRFLTFYHAVESASIKNEQLPGGSQSQPERVAQVDANASTTSPNGSAGDLGNLNNDTTSPNVTTTTISPQNPSDSNVITNQSDITTFTPRPSEDTESASPAITTEAPSDLQSTLGSFSTMIDANLESTTQSTAPQDTQINPRLGENSQADSTTISSNAPQDSTTTINSQTTVTTNAPTTIMNLDSEISSNDLSDDTPSNLRGTTMRNIEMTSTISNNLLDATTVAAVTSNPKTIDLFESPESNAIDESEAKSTEGIGPATSSDAPTTESVSGNIADAQTTEVPITSTLRNRLIDFAQDILSRLQDTIGSTSVPTAGGFTTTVPPATEISNIIVDSRGNTTLESLSQLRDIETTTRSSMNDATELTTVQPSDTRETTTVSSLNADQLNARISSESGMSQSSTGTSEQSSTVAPQESSTQFMLNTDSTTGGNAENSGASTEGLENSSSLPLEAEITTVSTATRQYTTLESDARTSNDTLLTELMTIAKTLFSEAMNETQQLLPLQSTTTGDLVTETSPASVETDDNATLTGNEVDQDSVTTGATPITEATTLASDTSAGQIDSTESSIETSSEYVDSSVENSSEIAEQSVETSSENVESNLETSSEFTESSIEVSSESAGSSIETSSETVESNIESSSEIESTSPVDVSENEVESNTDTSTPLDNSSGELGTTIEPRLGEDSTELTKLNETLLVDVETLNATMQTTTALPEVVSEVVEPNQLLSTTMLANIGSDTDTTTPLPTNTTQNSVEAMTLELTTNTYDLESRNAIATTETQTTPSRQTTYETMGEQTTELTGVTEETQTVNNVNESTTMSVTSMTEAPVFTSTNQPPEITMPPVVTVPESILSRVNTPVTPSTLSPEMTTEASVNMITESDAGLSVTSQESIVTVTTESSTEVVASVTNDTDITTNQTIEPVTEVAADLFSSDVTTRKDLPPESTTPTITTVSMGNANFVEETETTTNQPSLTIATERPVDVVSNPATTTEATNTLDETTTTSSIPQTTPNLENETPTVVARFQDATSTTAQGTAGSANTPTEQPTDTSIPTTSQNLFEPETPQSSTIPTAQPPLFQPSLPSTIGPTTTTGPTTMTETTTMTGNLDERIVTTESSGMDVFTVTAVSVNTASPETTVANIDENLISTEASADNMTTTTVSTGTSDNTNITSRIDNQEGSMNITTPESNANVTTSASMPETSPTMPTMMSSTTTSSTMAQPPTTPYLGRFGGSRITPAPRFSPSSTTKAPLRDYLIYGIYPNKTIVRKRPEDNLIDARNVDSPYVIFGIYPDGRLVRKFPNGTIIPDPPRSPVEVVFTLRTTTTTNRPLPRPYYNQANQGTYSQYQAPGYYSNPRPADDPMRNIPSPGNVDLGLTGNAIVGPNGGGPDFSGPLGSPASTGKMSDVLLNTRGGLSGNIASAIAGLLTPITSTGAPMRAATDSQGGRIVVDRERDEATRTKEAGGQRSSVYIGQDKFVNYWTNSRPDSNPRVLSVNINSVATAANEGASSSSSSVPSFENLLNNESGGQVTAPPGFPWRDPLDQILGITTNSPVITASVASNTLDDSSESNVPIAPRPVNPFVEVFSPISSTMAPARISSSTPTMASSTSSTTTTTMAPESITRMTVPNTPAPLTTTQTPVSMPSVVGEVSIQPRVPTTTESAIRSQEPAVIDLPDRLLATMQKQNAFGTTFDDLAFLNSLLQAQNPEATTPKTLTEVEQLLANKILSLALNNPGASRSSKAIQFGSGSPNSFTEEKYQKASTSGPIVIDLFPSSTASSPTWKAPVTQPASQKLAESTLAPDRVTWKPVSSTASTKRDTDTSKTTSAQILSTSTSTTTTTRGPVVITSKPATTPRPRTTTSVPFSFGAGLWQALFGGNFFSPPSPTRHTKQNIKQPSTTPRPVQITPKSVPTTQWPTKSPTVTTSTAKVETTTPTTTTTTTQRIDISKIQVVTPNSILSSGKSTVAASSISTTTQPILNNPNPRLPEVSSSTFSPQDDAKFLATLLRALQNSDTKGSASKSVPRLSDDDELFLRAILTGQTTTTTSTTPPSELSNAALLAALLKAQGIEPPMPASNLREQLQMASLGQSVTSAPSSYPATTTTTRPSSATVGSTATTTKKSATPRPTSRPRPRTTTWSPSSTYPPPLFSSFSNYGTRGQSTSGGGDSGNNRLFGATRAFSQFLGAAISGAAQQLQTFVRNGTRIVSEVVG